MAAYREIKAMTVRQVEKLRRNKPDSDTLQVCEKIMKKADFSMKRPKLQVVEQPSTT